MYVGGGWFTRRGLGPSVDVLGQHLASWTDDQLWNLRRVLSNAKRRLDQEGKRPTQIPDRLAERILDEARTADDELVAEYVGGVLASSMRHDGDAGIPWLSLIRQMPAYAVRSHYLFYASLHFLLVERGSVDDLLDVQMFVPVEDYATALGAEGDIEDVLSYVIPTFVKEGLIVPTYGQQEGRELVHPHDGTEGFFLTPSRLGTKLFFWGIGLGHSSWRQLGHAGLEVGESLLSLPVGCRLAKAGDPTRAEPSREKRWSISMGVSSPPKIGRPALVISVLSEVGTAPEELQVVVMAPDGSGAIGRDRAELFAQAQPSSSMHAMFPFEFAGARDDWPPAPGTYQVVAQAIRPTVQGNVPEQVAEAEFTVDENGEFSFPGDSESFQVP